VAKNATCYRGGLLGLLESLGAPEPEGVSIPPAFEHAIHSAYVVAEGDCSLLDELAARVRGAVEEASREHLGFEELLQMLVSCVDECSIRLTWSELKVAVCGDDGRRLDIVIRGIPIEVLITVKALCGAHFLAR